MPIPLRKNLPLMLATGAAAWCVFLAFTLVPVLRRGVQGPLEWRQMIALIVPVVVCAVAAFGAYRESRAPIVVAVILMCAFAFITGFSIGPAYTPAVALLVWALISSAARDPRRPRPRDMDGPQTKPAG